MFVLSSRMGLPGSTPPAENPHVAHDAPVDVEHRVEHQRADRPVARLADQLGRRDARNDGFQDVGDADAGFRAGLDGLFGGNGEDFFQLPLDAGQVGVGQVDLVDDRDDGQPLLDRQVEVGHGLRLDPLGGIDDEQRALAGGEAAGDLVGEIDVARGVQEVEAVFLAALGGVAHRDGMRLDGDAALALQVHGVEELVLFVAVGGGAGKFEQTVGERGLAVVDMRDDTKVAGELRIEHRRPGTMGGAGPSVNPRSRRG